MARAIAVLGTASDVGKSLVAAALGRLLRDAGYDVAPFKAQNMALNAGVTADGGEMGRAQILQAIACRLAPHVDMNPVLLKPMRDTVAQVVVLGKAQGTNDAATYFRPGNPLAGVADAALDRLAARHAVIVLEGAGSPVELNLMERDFVNLRPARRLGAALVLVADIDRGGVFAQVKGTLDLLPPEDRARVLGVVVNRFRGDPRLFEDGIARLESLTGVPVLALVPWIDHGLDEEDRPLRLPVDAPPLPGCLNVGVVLHPRVSNVEDVAPLVGEPDVRATWLTHGAAVGERDLIILPGTKSTVADLLQHTATGLAEAVREAAARGTWVLGLCGGYQMLGHALEDPHRTDGPVGTWPGLGLLDVTTRFRAEKVTTLASGHRSAWPVSGLPLGGYEIHHGHTEASAPTTAPIVAGAGAELGAVQRHVAGAYLHGLLANDAWRAAYLARVRAARGLPARPATTYATQDARLDRFAAHVRASLRTGAWDRVLASLSA